MDTPKRVSTRTGISSKHSCIFCASLQEAGETHTKAMVSVALNPAFANCARVGSKGVNGPGTPEGPACVASVLPTRSGIALAFPPQPATARTTALKTSVVYL